MENGKLTYADLPDVYKKLSADLPKEGIEHVPSTKSRKGYDTTGYGYQFHVNRLNEVLFGHWRAIHKVVKEHETKTASGKPMYKIVSLMIVQVGNWVSVDGENRFESLMEVEGYGGHSSLEEDSAFKGSYTNAFKKATAMLGVGKKAFEGTLDDDLMGIEQEKSGKNTTTTGTTQTTTGKKKYYPNKQQPTQPETKQTTQPQTTTTTTIEEGKQRKRFFAICGEKNLNLSDKKQKAIVYFYTKKESRALVTEKEFESINDALNNASQKEIEATLQAAVQKKKAATSAQQSQQGGAA